jgi:hypothetical protein
VPGLSNQKHERFAQAMAMPGAEQVPAYIAAGFGGKTKRTQESNASVLMRREDIKARIKDIKAERDRDLAVSVDRVVRELGPLEGMVTRTGRAKLHIEVLGEIRQIMKERAADPELASIPGGKLGHLVVTARNKDGSIKKTAVDTKLIGELRSESEYVARELGQWVEKRDDELTIRHLSDMPDEVLAEFIAALEAEVEKTKLKQPETLQLLRKDPDDEEPTGAGDPVVEYSAD